MRTLVYVVKPNDTIATIATKFGKDHRDLLRINRHLPTKVVWYANKPYTVFADLRIGQQLIIPEHWVTVQPTRLVRRPVGISGIGLGAGQGEYCDYSTWCDSGLTCSDTVNGGVCEGGSGPAQVVIGPDIQCQNQGGTWDGTNCNMPQAPPPVATPSCYPDVTGCNVDSDCCSGYCNTNIQVSGAAGQCQTKGVAPPVLGSCKLHYGDPCNVDHDCCSSKCKNGGCCGQTGQDCAQNSDCCEGNCGSNGTCVGSAPAVIASGSYPCNDPGSITQVQTNLATQFPFENTVGSWGVWGPADTAALAASGSTFADMYNKNTPYAPTCTGDPPADTYCPAGQNVDMTTGQCVAPATPPPQAKQCPANQVFDTATGQCVGCAANYQVNPQGTACIPNPNNIVPVTEHQCGDNQVWDDSQGKCVDKTTPFPWGWVIGGAAIVLGGGTIAYFAMKDKKKTGATTTTSSVPTTTPEMTPALATTEPRRYAQVRRY